MKTIKVIQKDIDDGVRTHGNECAVALAVRRAFRTKDVSVGLGSCRVKEKEYTLPKKCEKFIERFDLTGKGKPFSFELGKLKNDGFLKHSN